VTTTTATAVESLELAGEVVLRKREERRILDGHLWVFSNEIETTGGAPGPGTTVAVKRGDGRLLGYGIYNPHSLIAVRIFSRSNPTLGPDLMIERLRTAASLRGILYPGNSCYRLVHGESDDLPGLIIDRFGEAFCLQTLSLGMDRLKGTICDALESAFGAKLIVERNESTLRTLEGLAQQSGIIRGALEGPVRVEEADLSFVADLLGGHKTGFYYDQRENRIALRRYARVEKALDLYCNEGGFALHLARAGAGEVLGIDSSQASLGRAAESAALNDLDDRCTFEQEDVPQALQALHSAGERFGLVNLDPPSFTRSRKNVGPARRAYVDVNRKAIRVLERGGILASASCSHHITEETFMACVREAAASVGRRPILLEWRSQAPDHPIIPAMPETRYLKFGIFRVD
jgi:23S rRNA (cytosine1962-C5)-methyltransferase